MNKSLFPKYYVLEKLLENHRTEDSLKDFFIISVQHLMRSTGSLFEALVHWGLEPSHIFLTGKIYSSHSETIKKIKQLGINIKVPTVPDKLGYYADFLEKDVIDIWNQLKQALSPDAKIIILDDGGFVLKSVPDEILLNHRVFGIEQTTSGSRLQEVFKEFPVIHVATSNAKTIIEPPIVSEAVKIQLGEVIKKINPQSIGIIGYGHIGRAIAEEFFSEYNINVYDTNNLCLNQTKCRFSIFTSKTELLNSSDVIIGATGIDISELHWLRKLNGNKTLISVSSGDIEFNKLLRNCTPYLIEKAISPLDDLNIKVSNGKNLKILRGGLVANFTGKADSSPGHIIQVTRGLLFSAIIQIVENYSCLKRKIGAVKLSSELQREVVSLWFKDQPERKLIYGDEIISKFHDINRIEE